MEYFFCYKNICICNFWVIHIDVCEDEDAKCDRKLNFPPQTCSKYFFDIMYVGFGIQK